MLAFTIKSRKYLKKQNKILNLFLLIPLLLQISGFTYYAHQSCKMDCCKVSGQKKSCCEMNMGGQDYSSSSQLTKCTCKHDNPLKNEYITSNPERNNFTNCIFNNLLPDSGNKTNSSFFSDIHFISAPTEKLFIRNSVLLI